MEATTHHAPEGGALPTFEQKIAFEMIALERKRLEIEELRLRESQALNEREVELERLRIATNDAHVAVQNAVLTTVAPMFAELAERLMRSMDAEEERRKEAHEMFARVFSMASAKNEPAREPIVTPDAIQCAEEVAEELFASDEAIAEAEEAAAQSAEASGCQQATPWFRNGAPNAPHAVIG